MLKPCMYKPTPNSIQHYSPNMNRIYFNVIYRKIIDFPPQRSLNIVQKPPNGGLLQGFI